MREQATQRLSYADFFGYFLVRRQESNIPHSLEQKIKFLYPQTRENEIYNNIDV